MNRRENKRLNNGAEGANGGIRGCPLCEAPVFPLLQQVLLSVEVGLFVEDPDAIQDSCRLNLVVMPMISHIPQILGSLQHLATEVRTLVHPDPEHTGSLQDKDSCEFR